MSRLHIRAVGDTRISISGMPPLLIMCLRELPDILAKRDEPDVRGRIFPTLTTDDPKANKDWENLIVPELHQLFASAEETVAKDLAKLEKAPGKGNSFRVTFDVAHLNAWMSALNETRLILGELFHVTENDMAREDLDIENPKEFALLKIRALGWLLGHLIEFASGDSDRG